MHHGFHGLCLGLLLGLSGSASAINTVTFGDASYDGTNWTVEVLWTTSEATLAGFQFNLDDCLVVEAGNGLAGDGDWSIWHSDTTVLGFATALEDYIPPQLQPAVLVEVTIEADPGTVLTMSNVIFADEQAMKIELDASDSIVLEPCPTDFNGDGTTNVDDLLIIIAGWNDPYTVDDLLGVIAAWGGC